MSTERTSAHLQAETERINAISHQFFALCEHVGETYGFVKCKHARIISFLYGNQMYFTGRGLFACTLDITLMTCAAISGMTRIGLPSVKAK